MITKCIDFQRSPVYRAENKCFARKNSPQFRTFRTIPEIQQYCDELTRSDWFAQIFGDIDIKIRDGRGRRSACAWIGFNIIKLPRKFRKEWILLHEIAHLTAGRNDDKHGPVFCRNYLNLVGHKLGESAMERLLVSMQIESVQVAEGEAIEIS